MKNAPTLAALILCSTLATQSTAGGLAAPIDDPIIAPPPTEIITAPTTGWYGSAFVGPSLLSDYVTRPFVTDPDLVLSFDGGGIVGLTFGKHMGENWRAELEFSRTQNTLNNATFDGRPVTGTGSIDASYLLANVWYNIPTERTFRPYVGGGIGVGRAEPSFTFEEPAPPEFGETSFAYQLGFGAITPLTDSLSLDIGYRFRSIPGLQMSRERAGGTLNFDSASLNSHSVQVGVKFEF